MDRAPEWANDPGDYEVVEHETLWAEEVPDPCTLPTWVVGWMDVWKGQKLRRYEDQGADDSPFSESITVEVPGRDDREADIAEFGQLSRVLRAQFGTAAMQAGCPNYDPDDLVESAADAIANVLYAFPPEFHRAVLDRAVERRKEWPPKT
jgi:hypothetical protein